MGFPGPVVSLPSKLKEPLWKKRAIKRPEPPAKFDVWVNDGFMWWHNYVSGFPKSDAPFQIALLIICNTRFILLTPPFRIRVTF